MRAGQAAVPGGPALAVPPRLVWRGAKVPLGDAELITPLRRSCDRHADRPAVIDEKGELSYRQFRDRWEAIAATLAERLPEPGSAVACLLPRSADQIATLVAVLATGNIAVPVDPAEPQERIRDMIGIVRCKLAVTAAAGRVPEALAGLPRLALADVEAGPADRARGAKAGRREGKLVFFTSGSSGRPKAVEACQAPIVNALMWRRSLHGTGPQDRVLYKAPVGFDIALWEMFLPLLFGGAVVVAPPLGHIDPDYLSRAIAHQGVTIAQFTGSMLSRMLPVLARLPRSPRVICCGGESWNVELALACIRAFPRSAIFNIYGQTETSLGVLARRVDGSGPPTLALREVCHNASIFMVDETSRSVDGRAGNGELVIAGLPVAPGYAGAPEASARAFTTVSIGSETLRAYRSGDLFRATEDGLVFQGRNDNQVKIGGVRLELEAVENIARTLPQVGNALCRWNSAVGEMTIYVSAREGSLREEDVRRHLMRHLQASLLPRRIFLVDEIPTDPNGKIDRRAFADGG